MVASRADTGTCPGPSVVAIIMSGRPSWSVETLGRLSFSQTIINLEKVPLVALIVDRHPYAPDDRGLRSVAGGVIVYLTVTPPIGHARRLWWGL
jgi:hypothetical protein